MKHDRPKYMPDVAKVLRENEPAAFAERERQALAKLREEGLIERLTPEPAKRVSAPSPWAKDGEGAGGEVDKAELPSAMMPAADERPVTKPVETSAAKQWWPPSWKVAVGVAVMTALAFGLAVGVMAGRAKEKATAAAASAIVVMPSASATEEVVPNATAIPRPAATQTVAEPDAGATPSPVQSSPRPRPFHPPTIAPPVATDILP
jgi:hypothetical protein